MKQEPFRAFRLLQFQYPLGNKLFLNFVMDIQLYSSTHCVRHVTLVSAMGTFANFVAELNDEFVIF